MSSIFEQIKSQTNLLEVIAFYTEDELKKSGDDWYEMSDRSCPFCGHFDCFKVKHEEENSNYHCFSCEAHGDQITFVQKFCAPPEEEELDPVEAVKKIARDFNVKLTMRSLSPQERLMNAAAQYYHNRLLDSKVKIPVTIKNKDTAVIPLDYQTKKRHHKVGSLVDMTVGYSDGELCSYLLSIGESVEDIVSSGLGTLGDQDRKVSDFFPKGLFIYPHYKEGICCSFTQKDPSKVIKFQYPGKFRLNDILFFNQDSVKHHDTVYVVEGENDVLSLIDAKAKGAVIGTDGSISAKQMDWMKANLKGKKIIAIFDTDEAGDRYRTKLAEKVPGCTFIRLPEEIKDIDNYLESHSLEEVMKYEVVQIKEAVKSEEPAKKDAPKPADFDSETGIMERGGCYYKVRMDKEGNEIPTILTDFVILINNIYMVDGKRSREMTIVRNDGFRSKPMLLDSETKVSLKAFRSKMADAVDGSYYGSELELASLWRFVYSRSLERLVDIPDYVGDLTYDSVRAGWLFRNCYIRPTGEVIDKDDSGVMWWSGNLRGIRPRSISASLEDELSPKHKLSTIPEMNIAFSPEEIDEAERIFVTEYVTNFGGDIGRALLMVGWARMVAFSSDVFRYMDSVPFLHAWGGQGTGKTTVLTWLLDLYGMGDNGYAALANLGSTVGFARKMAYYSGLPMCVDEIRAGPEMNAIAGKLRSWYNRSQQDLAASGSQTMIHERPVRAVLIFGGQDIFTDPALRERCVVVRLSRDGREMVTTYAKIQTLKEQDRLTSIGFKWIQEALKTDYVTLKQELYRYHLLFRNAGIGSRTSWTWGIIGYFAKQLAERFYPEFDMDAYLLQACLEDSAVQSDNNTLNHFFEIIEGMMSKGDSEFSCEHFSVSTIKKNGQEKHRIALWVPEIYRLVMAERRDRSEESFTKEAISSAMKEEEYFLSYSTIKMGLRGSSRRVVIMDIDHERCPQSLKNIAEMARTF